MDQPSSSSSDTSTSPPQAQAIEVVISKLQEIVKEPSISSASSSASTDKLTKTVKSKNPQTNAPKVTSPKLMVQLPGLKGEVSAQNTDTRTLINALHKINNALGKVNAKTPISEAKATKNANTGENVYKCNQCEYWSHNKYYWKQHVDLVHNAERVYKCPFCDYAGKRSHSLKEHLVVHSNYRPYECYQCNASFRKKGHLTNHIKMHAQKKVEEETRCFVCNITITDSAALFAHLRSLHKDLKTVYACEFCQFATQYKGSIIMHMQAHGNPKTLCCNVCGYQTCHYNLLLEHFTNTHPKSELAFATVRSEKAQPVILMKCTECGFTAGSNDALRQHMYTHLDEDTLAKAQVQASSSQAPETPPTSAGSSTIPSPSPYYCTQCSFVATDPAAFIAHKKTHVSSNTETPTTTTMTTMTTAAEKQVPHIPGAKAVVSMDGAINTQGWFQCTICGYLGQQRTIKAHIWKHSGHKDVSYPMFENGAPTSNDDPPAGFTKVPNEITFTRLAKGVYKDDSAQGSTPSTSDDDRSQQTSDSNTELPKPEVDTKLGPIEMVIEGSTRSGIEGVNSEQSISTYEEIFVEEKSDAQEVLEEVQENGYTLIEIGELDEHISAVELSKTNAVTNESDVIVEENFEHDVETIATRKRKAEDLIESSPKVPKLENVIEDFPVPNSEDVGLEIEICCDETKEEKDESAEIMKALSCTRRSQEEIMALVALMESNQENKPKEPGICKSLLAVIEQLRERSTSISADDEQLLEHVEEVKANVEEDSSSEDSTHETTDCEVETIHKNVECIQNGYRCKLCHYFSLSTANMRTHMKQHKSKAPHECSLCEFEASSSTELQEHMLRHCKMRTFQCKQCLATFHYKGQLKAHMKEHTETSELARKQEMASRRCDICCEVFATIEKLQKHRESCFRPSTCGRCNGRIGRRRPHKCKKVYKCEACGVLCPNMAAMRQHSKEAHSVPENLQCELCDFLAVSIRSLKSHMKRHRNDQRFVEQPLEQYKCNLCGYVCHHLPSLKSHMWRHASDRNYSYPHTNDVINRALDNAVSGKAASVVTFRCCQCGFESVDKSELNNHMATHNDIIQKTLEVNKGRILGKMVERLQATTAAEAEVTKGKENAPKNTKG